ncbi:unnamed protein product [Durusdinium trenchii]|uniref:Uncharacterized protein n=1 Tax=Durusdinium trenchii TaxID=1381693 RepID=A0ABP0R3C4_9DINO
MRVLLAMCTSLYAVSAQREIDACIQQPEGQNCSFSAAGGIIESGTCQRIGPQNHSMLACLKPYASDPACHFGLFHSRSRACCAAHCAACNDERRTTSTSTDGDCSVEQILRLAPSCTESRAPCVVARVFATHPAPVPSGTTATTTTSDVATHAAVWVSELILPLVVGFAAGGCALTLCCYSLTLTLSPSRGARRESGETVPVSPVGGSAACVGERPKRERAKKPKAKRAKPKEDMPDLIDLRAENAAETARGAPNHGHEQSTIQLVDPWAPCAPLPPDASDPDPCSRSEGKWAQLESDLDAALSTHWSAPDFRWPEAPKVNGLFDPAQLL